MGIFTSYTPTTYLLPTDTFIIDRIANGGQTYSIQAQYMNFGNTIVMSNTYDIAMGYTGNIPENETIFVFNTATPFTLPSGLIGSQFSVQTAPDANVTFTLNKNTTNVGFLVFTNGSTTASPTFASTVSFTSGDELKVISNTTSNAQTLAMTFKGVKN